MMTPEELRDLDRQVAEHEGLQNPPATDSQIARAAFSFFSQSHPVYEGMRHLYTEYTFAIPEYGDAMLENRGSKFGYKGTEGNDGYGLWLWEQRDGQPWQAALEAAVAAWRKRPLCYSTDWAAGGPLIQKYELSVDWLCRLAGEPLTWVAGDTEAEGETPLIAICRAILTLPKEVGG